MSKSLTLHLKGCSGEDDQSIIRPKVKAPMDRPAIKKISTKKEKHRDIELSYKKYCNINLYHINYKQLHGTIDFE